MLRTAEDLGQGARWITKSCRRPREKFWPKACHLVIWPNEQKKYGTDLARLRHG